jgi:hypothetical protein
LNRSCAEVGSVIAGRYCHKASFSSLHQNRRKDTKKPNKRRGVTHQQHNGLALEKSVQGALWRRNFYVAFRAFVGISPKIISLV